MRRDLTTARMLGLGCALLGLAGCYDKGYRFVLPEAYVGWARVEFAVSGAKPMRIEDGFRLAVVPEDGLVVTSDSILLGQYLEEVYFNTGSGRVRAPDFGSRATVEDKKGHFSLEVFMGTRAEYERAGRRLDASGYHVTGRIAKGGGSP